MSASRPVNSVVIANVVPQPQSIAQTADMDWLLYLCSIQTHLAHENYPIESFWIINPYEAKQDISQLKIAASNINPATDKVLFCNVPDNYYQECLSDVGGRLKIKVLGLQNISSQTMSHLLEKLDFTCIKKIGIHSLSKESLWLLLMKLLALDIVGVKQISVFCSQSIALEWQQAFAEIKSNKAEFIRDNFIFAVNRMLGVLNEKVKIRALLNQQKETAAASQASLDYKIKELSQSLQDETEKSGKYKLETDKYVSKLTSQIDTNRKAIAAKQKQVETKQKEIEQLQKSAKKQQEDFDKSVAEMKQQCELSNQIAKDALAISAEHQATVSATHEADNFLISHEAEMALEITDQGKKIAELITQQQKIDAENSELLTRIQVFNKTNTQLCEANSQLSAAKAALLEAQCSLIKELAEQKNLSNAFQESLDDVENENQGLKAQVNIEKQIAVDLEEKTKELITKHAELVIKEQHLQQQLDSINERPQHHRESSSHHSHSKSLSKRRKTTTGSKPSPEEKQLAESTMQIELLRTQNTSLQTMLVAKEKELVAERKSKVSLDIKKRSATRETERLRQMLQDEKVKSADTASAVNAKIKSLEEKLHASEKKYHALEQAEASHRDTFMVFGIASPQSSPYLQSSSRPGRSPRLFPSPVPGFSLTPASDHNLIPNLTLGPRLGSS